MGFAGAVRAGCYGRCRQVRSGTVVTALTAVGKTISLDFGLDPTKGAGQKQFLPCLAQMVEGFSKEDPPTMKNCQSRLTYRNTL
jgi:hypothetical protein